MIEEIEARLKASVRCNDIYANACTHCQQLRDIVYLLAAVKRLKEAGENLRDALQIHYRRNNPNNIYIVEAREALGEWDKVIEKRKIS